MFIRDGIEKEKFLKDDQWTLKVCIDQTESPETYQQKAINTMVARQETGEVSFAIASLEGVDVESTYIPRHPLTDADREHFSIEKSYEEKPKKFKDLVEAVTNELLESASKLKPEADFDNVVNGR